MILFSPSAPAFVGASKEECAKVYGNPKGERDLEGITALVYQPSDPWFAGTSVAVEFLNGVATATRYENAKLKEFSPEFFSLIKKLNSKSGLPFNRVGYSADGKFQVYNREDSGAHMTVELTKAAVFFVSKEWVLRRAEGFFAPGTPTPQNNQDAPKDTPPQGKLMVIVSLPAEAAGLHENAKKQLAGSGEERRLAYLKMSNALGARAADLKAQVEKISQPEALFAVLRNQKAVSESVIIAEAAYGEVNLLTKVAAAKAELEYTQNLIAYLARRIINDPGSLFEESWLRDWQRAIRYKAPAE